MLYLAAQYLAAAAISFLAKKEDDSHTNLEFSITNAHLSSRPLNESGDLISLDYERFMLVWTNVNWTDTLRLDGSTHEQTLNWLKEKTAKALIAMPYTYKFHYEPPYEISDNFTFKLLNANKLAELTHLRIMAQLVLEQFLKANALDSEIRVWPHHFDTGAYAYTNSKQETAVGLGLAVPDSLISEHYFYISLYHNNAAISTDHLAALHEGQWLNTGFRGAVLPAMDTTVETVVDFFQEAYEHLMKEVEISQSTQD